MSAGAPGASGAPANTVPSAARRASFSPNLKPYLALFRIRFINSLQYRAAALAGVSTQFAWGFMEILAFSAFYRADPAAFPMRFSEMVSYIWMQQAFLSLFSAWYWETEISESITQGSIAYEMVRPMSLYGRWFSMQTANRLAGMLLRCVPILLVAFVIPQPFRASLPSDALQMGLFFVSMVLGVGVINAFSMLMYTSLFWVISYGGIRSISTSVVELLSGSIIPLPFFPPAIRRVAELMPFACMENMPLRIYSGNIAGVDAWRGIALQLFWLTVLVIAGQLAMRRALKKVVVQGG